MVGRCGNGTEQSRIKALDVQEQTEREMKKDTKNLEWQSKQKDFTMKWSNG